jgi:hypothetical protein
LKANAAAADLMMQQLCQIERRNAAEQVVINQIHNQILEVLMSDHTEECLDLRTWQLIA